ncbi:MAG: hypothetical protein IJ047_03265, partial [Paludibacteraceae bacterium]|nr:hypothetical protein [Paludibacteraceae bacterium]
MSFGMGGKYGHIEKGVHKNLMKDKTDIVSTQQFDEVIRLIQHTRSEIFRTANSQLIELYWQLGAYMSNKIES